MTPSHRRFRNGLPVSPGGAPSVPLFVSNSPGTQPTHTQGARVFGPLTKAATLAQEHQSQPKADDDEEDDSGDLILLQHVSNLIRTERALAKTTQEGGSQPSSPQLDDEGLLMT